MNWDELFEDRLADAGHRVGAIDEAGDHVTLVEPPVGEVVRVVREALLSDEAIERAADILEALDGDDYLTVARVALTAAIGGDGE